MTELERKAPFPPVGYVFTCSPDQFAAEGFGRDDVQRLFDWQDGKVSVDADEKIRLTRLALLVVRNAP